MNKPVTIDLTELALRAQPFVDSGQFATIEEVLGAGLAALEDARDDGEYDAATIAWLREKVAEAEDDPRPPVSLEEAFRIARGQSPE